MKKVFLFLGMVLSTVLVTAQESRRTRICWRGCCNKSK